MVPHNLPLSALRGFEAAGRLGSFTLAAGELNLTQSAISHQVSSLEEALGQPLFVRANRTICLTDAGVDFLRITRDVLKRLEQGVARLRAYSKPGSLIVAVPHDLAARWLLSRLPDFSAAHPDIDVWLYTTDGPVDLETDEIDLAICYANKNDPGPHARPLLRDPVAPMCAPSFAERHGLDDAAAIGEARLIHNERPLGWTEWCAGAGVVRRDVQKGPNFSDTGLALAAAEAGQGLALGGLALAADALEDGRLVVPFGPAMATEEIYTVAIHPELEERPDNAAVLAWVMDAAATTSRFISDLFADLEVDTGRQPT